MPVREIIPIIDTIFIDEPNTASDTTTPITQNGTVSMIMNG